MTTVLGHGLGAACGHLLIWNSSRGAHPRKRCVSVGAAPCGRPRAPAVARRGGCPHPPADHRPRCMLHHLGALHLVGAPVPSTEQSGSDHLQTPFRRAPRRTQLPGRPFYSPVKRGSGGERGRASEMPVSRPRRFFGFFLIAQKETRRRSGEPSVSFFRGCSACGRATFQRRKVAKVLRACGPGPGRVALFRWQFRPARCPQKGVQRLSLPFSSMDRTTCFYKMRCA